MPYGYKYPSDNEIYQGKIKQGELSDVPDGKLNRGGKDYNLDEKIKQGDLDYELSVSGIEELQSLEASINAMVKSIKYSMARLEDPKIKEELTSKDPAEDSP